MPVQLQAAPAANNTSTQKSFRLPSNVTPRRYTITLAPDLQSFHVDGSEIIEIVVGEATDRIVLNAVDINFKEVMVEHSDGTTLVGTVVEDPETELATISFDGVIGAGQWSLHISFRSELSEKLRGFYRSFHTTKDGERKTIASTHFEPTHARRAFPCFDEPEFKATFKVFLEVEERLTALSNGKQISSESLPAKGTEQARKRVEFAETMLLSTYLVAFVVGEFEHSRTVKVNGTEIRVFCVPGKLHLTEFALQCAVFATDFYERYFELPYPGEKIDHVAIPNFPIGAMENLGLITFRETALLVDETISSHIGLARVAEIVMHELAHMWFGDLVTMSWWNGLWLKESFATFMANVALDDYKPEWLVWNDFAVARASALETDSLRSTHAIENPVNHPDEATEMFDVISYQKGCSVLYQLHQFIGKEAFRLGCSRYLKAHAFGNTETFHLWDALEQAAFDSGLQVPVRRIMDVWVFQPGHPVIRVEPSAQSGCIELSQTKFCMSEDQPSNELWPIPVSIRVNRGDWEETKKLVLDSPTTTVYVGEDARRSIVNVDGAGFFRVLYNEDLLEEITDHLDTLTPVERFNLINDGWSAVRAGMMPGSKYLQLLERFRDDTSTAVWQVVSESLLHLNSLLDKEDKPLMQALVKKICAANLARLGLEPQAPGQESLESRKLRAVVVRLMGVVAEDDLVKARVRTLYDAWLQDCSTVDAELVPALIQVVAFDGDEALYGDFVRMSKTATTPQDTIRFLHALARFRRPDLVVKTASMCLSPDVRSQDAPHLFATLLRNPDASPIAWDFVKANFDTMKLSFPELAMHKLLEALSVLDTPELESDVRKFFAHHRVKAGETTVKQMLEQLRINVRLRQKEKAALKAAITG